MEFKALQQQHNFLERLDLLGIGINIKFNKQASHKNKNGGLVTVCLLGILGYQIKLILDQLYDYPHPYVLQEQKFTAEPQRYNLTSDKFILTFGFQNSTSQHYIDPTVYNATLTIKQTIKTKKEATGQFVVSTTIRTVKIEPCRIDYFNILEVNNYFISLSYQNMYCISTEETDLYFQGQFDAQHYSAFELVLDKSLSQLGDYLILKSRQNESDKKKQDQNKSSQENDKKEEMYAQAADQILITKEDQQKTSFKFELQKSINQKSQGSSSKKAMEKNKIFNKVEFYKNLKEQTKLQ
ncbi:hypothetical protein TTHERM_000109302 (macronuclear) [Tetrahymena thermophila SB210]|uniref:Uncharacterized protein n=1 Tax=Tetrahymena thermophila (strain SB210) TaxID=312017 RepID=W7XL67_TETTS|nr:hypothetical protein TTHERM_000109302 [Tetrahymena thermophila SB210]EWS75759.1 hypothetical protein TTHERM_000109302 [Tetrahymena thermophila SB210]|eukprot:XP_012651681.1 hypothetical protein TTHERM_000109302 [Tetrahymena thermophila SB210]